jgi:SPP1 gp7 family putative phage head morphogenesis protein
MPWTVKNPPDVAKNWTTTEKRKCVSAANAVLREGGSDQQAIFACIRAAGKSKRKKDASEAELATDTTLVGKAKYLEKTKGKRIPNPIIPPTTKSLERIYYSRLLKIVNQLISLGNQYVIPQIGPIVENAQLLRPTSNSLHFDGYIEDIGKVMSIYRIKFYQAVPEKAEEQIARNQAFDVEAQNSRYFNRLSKQVVAIELARSEPWLSGEVNAFVTENVRLIKSISEQHFESVETLITEGVRRGRLTTDITKDVRKRYKTTKSRAKLIARDQTSKFNGDLTRLRQTDAGFEKYKWLTSKDERVRPSHKANDGKIFSWSRPPATGHPGEDYQCRCVAIPVFE